MKVAVTGAGGLIGAPLTASLRADGHEVVRLVRRPPRAPDEAPWDPRAGKVATSALAGLDAVVHLAGAGVADRRWTETYREEIRASRVLGTRTLVRALRHCDRAPRLVSASAIGFYGERGEEALTEQSGSGTTFLAGVVRDWEAEALAGEQDGLSVVTARTGLVLSPEGGALGRMLPLLRLGLGGPLGSGRQWWSWITLADEVAALRFLLGSPLTGPVNLTAPNPARQGDVVRAFARALSRPARLPVPSPALRLALGEFAGEVLGSQRVLPQRLLDAGFPFRHRVVDEAAAWLAGGADPQA